MSTIVPEGEKLRQAIRWISDERVSRPEAKLWRILEEAALRFDLSPNEEAFLRETFLHKDQAPG